MRCREPSLLAYRTGRSLYLRRGPSPSLPDFIASYAFRSRPEDPHCGQKIFAPPARLFSLRQAEVSTGATSQPSSLPLSRCLFDGDGIRFRLTACTNLMLNITFGRSLATTSFTPRCAIFSEAACLSCNSDHCSQLKLDDYKFWVPRDLTRVGFQVSTWQRNCASKPDAAAVRKRRNLRLAILKTWANDPQ